MINSQEQITGASFPLFPRSSFVAEQVEEYGRAYADVDSAPVDDIPPAPNLLKGEGFMSVPTDESSGVPLDQEAVPGDDNDMPKHWSVRAAGMAGRAGLDLALIAPLARGYFWEFGPENEAFRGKWAVRAIQEAHEHLVNVGDPRALAVAKTAGAAALTVGGITLAVETAVGVGAAVVANQKKGLLGVFNRATGWAGEKIAGGVADEYGRPKGETELALAGGTVPVVFARNALAGPEGRPFKDNAKTAVSAGAKIALFSSGIAAATDVAIETADIHGHTEFAMDALDVAAAPETWWKLFGALYAWKLTKFTALRAAQRVAPHWYNRDSEIAVAESYDVDALDAVISRQEVDRERIRLAVLAEDEAKAKSKAPHQEPECITEPVKQTSTQFEGVVA